MISYFHECSIDWNFEQRLGIYKTLELYEVHAPEFIGFVAFREYDGEFYLADIQILQGKRNQGYGTNLLTEAKRIAAKRGYKNILLKVFKTSPAIQLYMRNGFTRMSEEQYVYVLKAKTE